jgi:ferredoxin-like protein FixX
VEWYEDTEPFIKVNLKKCIGCSNCVNVCLARCFEIFEKKAKIRSLELCMECAACWYVCSENAIIFAWPKGGKGYRSDWG